MSLPQNLLALCETMLPGENQRGRPDAATLKRLYLDRILCCF